MKQVTITCPKCRWQYHVAEGALKATCINPECDQVVTLSKAGTVVEAEREDWRTGDMLDDGKSAPEGPEK